MSHFEVHNGEVVMIGDHKPVRLADWQCDRLLDLFEDTSAADLFNRLYAAQKAAMGELFLPRVTAFRTAPTLIVDNTMDVAAHTFTRTLEQTL